jgi:hypothetical protein
MHTLNQNNLVGINGITLNQIRMNKCIVFIVFFKILILGISSCSFDNKTKPSDSLTKNDKVEDLLDEAILWVQNDIEQKKYEEFKSKGEKPYFMEKVELSMLGMNVYKVSSRFCTYCQRYFVLENIVNEKLYLMTCSDSQEEQRMEYLQWQNPYKNFMSNRNLDFRVFEQYCNQSGYIKSNGLDHKGVGIFISEYIKYKGLGNYIKNEKIVTVSTLEELEISQSKYINRRLKKWGSRLENVEDHFLSNAENIHSFLKELIELRKLNKKLYFDGFDWIRERKGEQYIYFDGYFYHILLILNQPNNHPFKSLQIEYFTL